MCVFFLFVLYKKYFFSYSINYLLILIFYLSVKIVFHIDLIDIMSTTPGTIGPHSRKKVSYYYDYDVGNYYYG